ncbi:hypothetical protein MKEN_00002900 [Mycena kentingensis (nom. inval.)]|nr:hypothetical protein MKEN_00002900 [Mycena kentingensis (nom. inval.)]
MACSRRRLICSLLTLAAPLLLPVAHAVPTNVTIDDADLGYFSWSPGSEDDPSAPASWAAISPGHECGYCSAQPLSSSIHDGTWHDGSNTSVGSISFQGTAIWLYGIDLDNPANISFTLDGAPAGSHHYNGSARFIFDALFFSASGLSAKEGENHTVAWTLHATKTNGTTALFDYAVVTVERDASSSSASAGDSLPTGTGDDVQSSGTPSKTSAIIAGVVSGVVLLIAAAILFVFRRRRRTRARSGPGSEAGASSVTGSKRSRRRKPAHIEPFMSQSGSAGGSIHRSLGTGTMSMGAVTTSPTSPGDSKLAVWTSPSASAPYDIPALGRDDASTSASPATPASSSLSVLSSKLPPLAPNRARTRSLSTSNTLSTRATLGTTPSNPNPNTPLPRLPNNAHDHHNAKSVDLTTNVAAHAHHRRWERERSGTRTAAGGEAGVARGAG